jgi:hypothetical protein
VLPHLKPVFAEQRYLGRNEGVFSSGETIPIMDDEYSHFEVLIPTIPRRVAARRSSTKRLRFE